MLDLRIILLFAIITYINKERSVMNLKLKALAILVGIMGAGVVGGMLMNTITALLGPEATVNVFIGGVLLFLFYQVYGLILSKLEMDQKIDELTKK